MSKEFQVRPADVAAYIVFQFKALEATLNVYNLGTFAERVQLLKCAFIAHALEQEARNFNESKNNYKQKNTPTKL